MGAEEHRGLVGAAQGLQSVLHGWYDGLCHPLHIILIGGHGLAEAYEEPDVRIVLYESLYRLVCIVMEQWRYGAVAVLCLYAVVLGEWL